MNVILAKTCNCANFKDECFKVLIFPLVISLIATIFAVIILYLLRGIQKGNLSNEEKVYFSLVIFACSVIIITLCCAFIKIIGSTFIILKMKS